MTHRTSFSSPFPTSRHLFATVFLLGTACASATTPWEGDAALIVGPDGQTASGTAGDCVALDGFDCVDTAGKCEDGATLEVYVDAKGKPISTVCYPTDGSAEVLSGATELPDGVDNKDFLVVEGDADAPGFQGDLELSGNNVTLYGESSETAVVDGDLLVSKNNVLVTGVTITGNSVVTFNNATFSRCVIEGNLVIKGNDATIAGCHVLGNIVIEGNNTVLVGNQVDGNIEISDGKNTACTDNYRGESLETGEVLTCGE